MTILLQRMTIATDLPKEHVLHHEAVKDPE